MHASLYIASNQHVILTLPPSLPPSLSTDYDINTFIAKIPETRLLPNGYHEDVAFRFLGQAWARLFFDHTSEVMVRRIGPHAALIRAHEYVELNPAVPPDAHVRVLLGRAPGNASRLGGELKRCLAQPYVEVRSRKKQCPQQSRLLSFPALHAPPTRGPALHDVPAAGLHAPIPAPWPA